MTLVVAQPKHLLFNPLLFPWSTEPLLSSPPPPPPPPPPYMAVEIQHLGVRSSRTRRSLP